MRNYNEALVKNLAGLWLTEPHTLNFCSRSLGLSALDTHVVRSVLRLHQRETFRLWHPPQSCVGPDAKTLVLLNKEAVILRFQFHPYANAGPKA